MPEYFMPLLMILSLIILLFSGYPVGLVLTGVGLVFGAVGIALGDFSQATVYLLPLRMYGNISENLIYPAIPLLIFIGMALEKSGIARELLLCLQMILRRIPGNLAVSVLVIGMILAPTAGLIGASVATLAVIALPTMLDQDYAPPYATGAIAASGTLGIMMPPGVMLFFLADLLDQRISNIFLGALLPVGIVFVLLVIYHVATAWMFPHVAPNPPAQTTYSRRALWLYALRSLVLPITFIGLILGSIIGGIATPSQSAAVGAGGAVLLMLINRSLSLDNLHQAIMRTAETTVMVFMVIIGASIFSLVFRKYGGEQMILGLFDTLALGAWGTLLMILFVMFILGFFVDWLEILLVTVPIFSPILDGLDFGASMGSFQGTWVAILIGLVLQTSFLTPPFGFALFFLKGAAPPDVQLTDIYKGAMGIVGLQILAVALVLLIPALAIYLPSLIPE